MSWSNLYFKGREKYRRAEVSGNPVGLQAFAILLFNQMATFTVCVFIHVYPLYLAGLQTQPDPCEQHTESRKDGAWTSQAAVSNRFVCTDYPFSLVHMIVLSTHK